MLSKMFSFTPSDIPLEGELKPLEVAIVKSVRNLELAMIKLSTIWMTVLLIIGVLWGAGGFIFAQKLEEYSATIKTTVQMEVEILNIKERVRNLEIRNETYVQTQRGN